KRMQLAVAEIERLTWVEQEHAVHGYVELDGQIADRGERADQSRLRCPLQHLEQRAHVVAVGVTEPYPAKVSRVDDRAERIEERLLLDRSAGVDEHRLLGMKNIGIDRQDTEAGNLDLVTDRVDVAELLNLHVCPRRI